ncbi:hypothetical protein [Streptomyces sp. NPDC090025]|uniref:hypothetical protein n=1 Tax=Streptomyces sp. NPDC090025 TaxID=3365922 RepID=UPI0038355F36
MPALPRLAAPLAAALALLAPAGATTATATAATPSGGDPTVSHARVLAHFPFAAGRAPENIALEPDGSADVTFSFARQVARVDRTGAVTVLATLPPVADPHTPLIGAAAVSGIARAEDGTLYVNYATGTAETGVWRIAPGAAPEQIAQLPADGLPNGLALDEECGTLYVADSARGVVWSVPRDGGAPAVWAEGAALRAAAAGGFGANGLKFRDGAVWVSNTDRATLLRIPAGPPPERAAGPVEVRASGLTGIDDFAFTGHHGGTVLAALLPSDEVALVRPDGSHKTVLTAKDGLRNPTSLAVHAKRVHVNSAAYYATSAPDPNLLVARISKNKR